MTDRDKIIETMARGIAQEIAQPSYSHLDEVPGRDAAHAAVSGLAQAALTAYESHLQASGMAVVPVEPSEAMILAGTREIMSPSPQTDTREAWDAMLSAYAREST